MRRHLRQTGTLSRGGVVLPDDPTPFRDSILALSPWMLWEMQHLNGNVPDASGNGRTGTAAGSPLYSQPGPGIGARTLYAVQGTTTSDRFFAASNPNLQNNFSIVVVFYPGSATASRNLFSSASGGNHITINTTASNNFFVVVQGVAGEANSANVLTVNRWHLIVVVRESNTWKYYLDGALDTANAGVAAPGAAQTGNLDTGQTAVGDRLGPYAVLPSYVLSPSEISTLWTQLKLGA